MAVRHSILACWTAVVLASGLMSGPPLLADEPPAPPAPAPAAPKAAKAKLAPLPVKLTVTATSPDPPWTMRIENAGTTRVRIPADSLLLSFDLRTAKNGAVKKCKPPRAMIPGEFPEKRELYLDPGEFYEEEIDPRLYCFGDSMLQLKPGAKLVPRFGFGTAYGAAKEPFAAQGSERHDPHAPLRELVGEEITLPAVPQPAAPLTFAPGAPAATAPSAPPPQPQAKDGKGKTAPAQAEADDAPADEAPEPPPPTPVDHNAGHLNIYLTERMDAGAPRDIALSIRAVNEGKRTLTTVLRGRMLHFHVEQLGPDNRPIGHVECMHQEGAHGIAAEMTSKVKPGKQLTIPLLVAEVCPRNTFPRPGLYRVIPTLDTAQEGEILKHDPWLGKALARQSALVRVGTARDEFHFNPPRTGPAKLKQGVLTVASDPPKKPAPSPKP